MGRSTASRMGLLLALVIGLAGVGLGWACPRPPRPAPNGGEPAGLVHLTRTGKEYHRSGCPYLRSSDIPVTRAEAVRLGRVPCVDCGA